MGGARGGEARQLRAVGRRVSCVAVVMTTLAAWPAGALDVRVGWRPVQGVAGYRLYVRPLGLPYGPGIDLGFLQAQVDGVVRHVTASVPLVTTAYFVVTAYDSAGRESGFSNELALQVSAPPTATRIPATATRTATPAPMATRSATAPFTATRTPTFPFTPTRSPTPTRPSTTATPTRTAISASGTTVSGNIHYYADDGPVPDANMTMRGGVGSMSATSDEVGVFRFSGVGLGIWQLFPQKYGDLRQGISSYDAAFVLQTVSGVRSLTAVERLACDVTGNGALSALDASRILQYAVGILGRLPAASRCGSDWVFVPQPLTLLGLRAVDAELTTNSCQPASIVFEPLLGSIGQQNFVAAVFGDCTGNWSAGGSGGALRQIARPAQARLGAARHRPGERWLVPLHVEGRDTLDAFEAHLGYDSGAATLEAVELSGEPIDSLLDYRADTSGELTIALAGTAPLTLGERPLLVLVFSAADAPAVRLYDAMVDDAPAQIEE